jgi:dihydrofolate reductase
MPEAQPRQARNLYLFMSLSIDGYFEGPNHDISWHRVDDEFNRFAIEQLKETDLFLWGRRVYQLMEAYWPGAADDPATTKDNREVADFMNNTEKIVFSRTLDKVSETRNWRRVRLVRKFEPVEIRRLKEGPGRDIGVGGSELAVSFADAGLIDEFRFMITPVALGAGTPVLQGMKRKLKLELVRTRRFGSGNLLLYYKPVKEPGASQMPLSRTVRHEGT